MLSVMTILFRKVSAKVQDMEIHFIRHATFLLHVGDVTLLIGSNVKSKAFYGSGGELQESGAHSDG